MSKQHQHFNVWRITCEDRSRSWSWRRSQSQERHLSALSGSLQSWNWGSFGSPISLFKAHRLRDLFIKHLTRATCCIIEGLAVFNNLSRLTAIQCFTLLNLCVCVCVGQILLRCHELGEFPFVCPLDTWHIAGGAKAGIPEWQIPC